MTDAGTLAPRQCAYCKKPYEEREAYAWRIFVSPANEALPACGDRCNERLGKLEEKRKQRRAAAIAAKSAAPKVGA